jgi:hypothetical protein
MGLAHCGPRSRKQRRYRTRESSTGIRENQHHMLLLSFVIILQSCYKRSWHPRKPTSHAATIFCNHLAKLLQKIMASEKNQHIASKKNRHIASWHATIFCPLRRLLQATFSEMEGRIQKPLDLRPHRLKNATINAFARADAQVRGE